MCGIAGYIGEKKRIKFLLNLLKKEEYRGYDSCGIAVRREKGIFVKKNKGKITHLEEKMSEFDFSLGIAHTRWATHGFPNQINAHPQSDCKKKIFLVHNGIIENYSRLKDFLTQRGHHFISHTDTEVIPHLIEELGKREPLPKALIEVVNKLEGNFAFAFIREGEDALFLAKKGSPLNIGVLNQGFIFASDIPAMVSFTNRIVRLEDEQIAIVKKDDLKIFDFAGKEIIHKTEIVDLAPGEVTKKNYAHFMLKEIFEQPRVMRNLFKFYVNDNRIEFKGLNLREDFLRRLKKIFLFACGTAFHAGYVIKYFLEKFCCLDVSIDVSSEARYRELNLTADDLVIAISQSGETADTLAAVRKAKEKGAYILAVCNVLGSSLVKESSGLLYTLAGPEIGVASTKAYTAQLFTLYLFSLHLGLLRNTLQRKVFESILQELKNIPRFQEEILKRVEEIKRIAEKFSKFGCFLFLGRGINYPSSLEGALKLKEISYIPAEGYPAGEMKHGPIALIDEYRAVVCICLQDVLYEKMVSNLQEIKARKGKILSILNYGDKEAVALSDEVIYLPRLKNSLLSPLVVAIPLQLFAYFVAENLGCEIDQPRNLAKSVTVE
ncbi:MAG: glutamine--fructose-6-phosphate transaminase (isomerizing) [Candidatus Omnitrophica bacterium 4484_70.2]|nr:MAG: glutamine--fructose-6-phosphate transaminase (isomerizing) [Candidatus Omnitrophica bacterium 4484_70.2]